MYVCMYIGMLPNGHHDLKMDLPTYIQNQERGVEGLRAELKEAQATIDDMKMQHSAWVGRYVSTCTLWWIL